VHAEGEHRVVAGEDGVRPVPLMHVQVYDGGAPHPAVALECAHGHRDVVEHAKALAVVGEGVVGTAGQVHRHAVLQGGPRGRHRPPHRPVRALHEMRRPRESDPPLLGRRQPPARQALDVVRPVYEE
jgi:hypothetical protein